MTSCMFPQLIRCPPCSWTPCGLWLGMRELTKVLLLSGLQNQASPQWVLAFPQSNPVIIIPTAGAFPSPNLLTETTAVWDNRSGFNRTSSHLPTLPSVRAALTLAFILLERGVPYPPLKGNVAQSLWCCPTLSNKRLFCRPVKFINVELLLLCIFVTFKLGPLSFLWDLEPWFGS